MLHHATRPGIVCGQGQRKILVEFIQARLEKTHPAFDILLDIKGIFNAQGGGRFGHKLHKTHGALGGNCDRVETGLLADHGLDEFRVNPMLSGVFLDQPGHLGVFDHNSGAGRGSSGSQRGQPRNGLGPENGGLFKNKDLHLSRFRVRDPGSRRRSSGSMTVNAVKVRNIRL